MSDQSSQPEENKVGSSDHEQHRTPEGQGSESTMSAEEEGPAELTVFDGKGNEMVMVTTDDEDGKAKQGRGHTVEEALKDVKDSKGAMGDNITGH